MQSVLETLSVFEDPRYSALAVRLRNSYGTAEPFPHIVIDDFLPKDVAFMLAASYPSISSAEIKTWKLHQNENTSRWFLEDSSRFPAPLKAFALATVSRPFLQFMATITGIHSLLADPYFIGGGAMMTGQGGFLRVHADFNWHALPQVWRRANALFYLTPGWQSAWGGSLELWSKDAATRVASIEPKFNRLVVFSTTSDSYHGQPDPLTCPPHISRNIFSAFFYSSQSSEGIETDPHFTKYALNLSPYGEAVLKEYEEAGDHQV